MDWLNDLFTNEFLITGLASWFVAQMLKTVIHLILYKKLDIQRLYGDGGMPSGHSATVSSLATMCGLKLGFGSVEFAVSTILAIIVCHDAMGVRRETGKQARIINELLRFLESARETNLKELVGHTPLQVWTGIFIGIVNTLLLDNWL